MPEFCFYLSELTGSLCHKKFRLFYSLRPVTWLVLRRMVLPQTPCKKNSCLFILDRKKQIPLIPTYSSNASHTVALEAVKFNLIKTHAHYRFCRNNPKKFKSFKFEEKNSVFLKLTLEMKSRVCGFKVKVTEKTETICSTRQCFVPGLEEYLCNISLQSLLCSD